MEPKEQWIEETLNSLNGLKQVTASGALKNRLKSIPINISPGIRVMVPKRSVWLAAGSIVLIIGINITAIYATQPQTTDTETAKQRVQALEKDHFRVKDSLINVSRQLHEDLFVSFKDPSKDSASIQQLIDHIVENQRETEQMTFDYFKEVEKFCTPSQKKKLQKAIHGALLRVNPPPPPPHGDREHP